MMIILEQKYLIHIDGLMDCRSSSAFLPLFSSDIQEKQPIRKQALTVSRYFPPQISDGRGKEPSTEKRGDLP